MAEAQQCGAGLRAGGPDLAARGSPAGSPALLDTGPKIIPVVPPPPWCYFFAADEFGAKGEGV